MTNNYIDPFEYNTPSIDLHGMTSDIARVYIKDFIKENYKLNNKKIIIIHGFGTGVLRKVTNEVLEKDKKVISYRTDYYNGGTTIATLNVK